jgi:intraflagellar transport protein 88
MSVIAWLGAYYVECEVYEQAIQFFERAAMIQPNDVKWQLMVASCYRRSGNYQQALDTYKKINDRFPENVECESSGVSFSLGVLTFPSCILGLRFLVRICTDLGMKDVQDYVVKLGQAEKLKLAKEAKAQEKKQEENQNQQRPTSISDAATSSRSNLMEDSKGRVDQQVMYNNNDKGNL